MMKSPYWSVDKPMSWATYLQALQAAALVQLCWTFLSIWTEPLRIVYIPMPDIPQKYHSLCMWKVWLVAVAVWVLAIFWLILHLEEILFLAFMWRMRRTIWLNPSNSGNNASQETFGVSLQEIFLYSREKTRYFSTKSSHLLSYIWDQNFWYWWPIYEVKCSCSRQCSGTWRKSVVMATNFLSLDFCGMWFKFGNNI